MKLIKVSAMWCPACLIVNKNMKKIKDEYPKIEYIDYDYDFNSEEVKYYGVGQTLPVLILLDDENSEITRLAGEVSYEKINETIKRYESA